MILWKKKWIKEIKDVIRFIKRYAKIRRYFSWIQRNS